MRSPVQEIDRSVLGSSTMRNASSQLWFQSDLFSVEPGEDEETNPQRYGKQLAAWVAEKFLAAGFTPEPIIAEDWGWCVMLERKPFSLWVGCGNVRSELYHSVSPEKKLAFLPQANERKWTCFVGSDVHIWTPFFWRRLFGGANTDEAVDRVVSALAQIIKAEPRITLTEEL